MRARCALALSLAACSADGSFVEPIGACKDALAFHNGAEGSREIWLAHWNGTVIGNLSDDRADDAFPSWAPNGETLAFQSNRRGNWDIFTVNADGTGLRNITPDSDLDDVAPSWSPRGDKIAYARRTVYDDGLASAVVMIASINGTPEVAIDGADVVSGLSWSSEGDWLSYVRFSKDYSDLFLLNVASMIETLVPGSQGAGAPRWLSDAEGIMTHGNIYKFDTAGMLTQITTGTAVHYSPVPSTNREMIFTRVEMGKPVAMWRQLTELGAPASLLPPGETMPPFIDIATSVALESQIAFHRLSGDSRSTIGVVDGAEYHLFTGEGANNAEQAVFPRCR